MASQLSPQSLAKVNSALYAIRVNPISRLEDTDTATEHLPHQEEIVEIYNSLGEIQVNTKKRLLGVA
jgi:hypothetical protein